MSTMSILMFEMMVAGVTRRFDEPDSRQPRIQSAITENASEIIPHPTCKLIHRLADNEAVDPAKRHDSSLNLSATKTLENLPKGAKISLTL
ncbi:hypothetical protein E3N88_25606 [Mikania micrantha]|uniref:Uncharacterized protein n=1 Tax=Mikania micrantha TaxID=192012 RepID=A0A5N6N810_9ASTR|nr:hypothetical protein E3N88_25606 [Mikania micrantha]